MKVLKPTSGCESRKAFTLVEVMVASILISVVGLSLLQMHHNSAEMSYKMQEKFRYSDWVLMASFEHKLEKTRKRTNFRTLTKPFNIDDRGIRTGLDQKTEISSDLHERINASDIAGEIEEKSEEFTPIYEGLRLEVYRQDVSMDHETYSLYRVLKP